MTLQCSCIGYEKFIVNIEFHAVSFIHLSFFVDLKAMKV